MPRELRGALVKAAFRVRCHPPPRRSVLAWPSSPLAWTYAGGATGCGAPVLRATNVELFRFIIRSLFILMFTVIAPSGAFGIIRVAVGLMPEKPTRNR